MPPELNPVTSIETTKYMRTYIRVVKTITSMHIAQSEKLLFVNEAATQQRICINK